MIPIHNYVSKILFYDKESSYTVITYIDFENITKEEILKYMKDVLEKNDILKNCVVHKDGNLYFETKKDIHLEDQYEIQELKKDDYSKKSEDILNSAFSTDLQWRFYWFLDSESKSWRLYFKIHHGYADGYQIIRILTSPFKDEYIEKKFKRKASSFEMIYSIVFGFICLISIYFRFLWNLFSVNEKLKNENNEYNFILFDEIHLETLKEAVKEKKITINDFLYSLMLLTDQYYFKEKQTLYISSPISISINKDTNNISPIFNVVDISHSKDILVQDVHTTFNALKYSYFIPCLTVCVNLFTRILPLSILVSIYNRIMEKSNYAFSNIIGPDLQNVPIKITNIGFLTTPKNSEIVYNIISYQNNITLNVTFKKDRIKDKDKYLQCLRNAYKDLL